MCRFLAYLGYSPIGIGQLIEAPSNSLINQSHARRGSMGGINGDGFGLAWYNGTQDTEPGLFKSTQPAWNDANLRHLSRKISSSCFMAHVRASTVGDVSQDNCHPFSYGPYTFVHNGTPHSSLKCNPCYIFLKGLERRKPSEGFSGCRIII